MILRDFHQWRCRDDALRMAYYMIGWMRLDDDDSAERLADYLWEAAPSRGTGARFDWHTHPVNKLKKDEFLSIINGGA